MGLPPPFLTKIAAGKPEIIFYRGVGFSLADVEDPHIEKKIRSGRKRGWGLKIIQGLMDEVRILSGSKGTTVIMSKARGGGSRESSPKVLKLTIERRDGLAVIYTEGYINNQGGEEIARAAYSLLDDAPVASCSTSPARGSSTRSASRS